MLADTNPGLDFTELAIIGGDQASQDYNTIWQWTYPGTWEFMTKLKQGETGPQGPAGPQGPIGPQGPAGSGGESWETIMDWAIMAQNENYYETALGGDLTIIYKKFKLQVGRWYYENGVYTSFSIKEIIIDIESLNKIINNPSVPEKYFETSDVVNLISPGIDLIPYKFGVSYNRGQTTLTHFNLTLDRANTSSLIKWKIAGTKNSLWQELEEGIDGE